MGLCWPFFIILAEPKLLPVVLCAVGLFHLHLSRGLIKQQILDNFVADIVVHVVHCGFDHEELITQLIRLFPQLPHQLIPQLLETAGDHGLDLVLV